MFESLSKYYDYITDLNANKVLKYNIPSNFIQTCNYDLTHANKINYKNIKIKHFKFLQNFHGA